MSQMHRFSLLLMCAATGLFAFVLLESYSQQKAPLYKRFESQWAADVASLESSGKLPASWAQVKTVNVIGGTPETKSWLKRIEIPLKENPEGQHRMDVLVVVWEENGKRGALVQYNIEDGKTRNNLLELGRTLILSTPETERSLSENLTAMFQSIAPTSPPKTPLTSTPDVAPNDSSSEPSNAPAPSGTAPQKAAK